MLADDIRDRLEKDFGLEARRSSEAIEAFVGTFKQLGTAHRVDRIVRCIVHLSGGDRQKLEHYIQAALGDPRDVIYWAEYDKNDRRTYDFTAGFSKIV